MRSYYISGNLFYENIIRFSVANIASDETKMESSVQEFFFSLAVERLYIMQIRFEKSVIGIDTDIEALLHRQAQQPPERREGKRERKRERTSECRI